MTKQEQKTYDSLTASEKKTYDFCKKYGDSHRLCMQSVEMHRRDAKRFKSQEWEDVTNWMSN